MRYDCLIVGGGPAGLNAALVLGRAKRKVLLVDSGNPRNAVTRESHGFITRDGVKPEEFRQLAHRELAAYPGIQVLHGKAVGIVKRGDMRFELSTEEGGRYEGRTVVLATGLRDCLPPVPGLERYYGNSLFSCPYCDGWEQRDRPLAVIADTAEHAYHMAVMAYQWSADIAVCLNGGESLGDEQTEKLRSKGIAVYAQRIASLRGEEGMLSAIVFDDGAAIERTGGFVASKWEHPIDFAGMLGLSLNEHGGIAADDFGRTNVEGLYATGDASLIVPAQLIAAAAGGSRAAMGVNAQLIHADF
ncbi:NAD(P)/FAD-dependent oxidoreductase [Paenibacillus sp. NPDC058071]|uniref:NAD(P)/FAD-dependent oxidoreductase n=1 Tax=Paenibacillus sp. NPDC058071 TaxID=3346326 RepID=UPI0036DD171F